MDVVLVDIAMTKADGPDASMDNYGFLITSHAYAWAKVW